MSYYFEKIEFFDQWFILSPSKKEKDIVENGPNDKQFLIDKIY